MKKTQQLSDLPVRYQKIPKSNWWLDTITNFYIHNSKIHTYCKGYKKAKEESTLAKRWDLKY